MANTGQDDNKNLLCVEVKTLNGRETENKIKMCSEGRTKDGKVREDTDARGMLTEGCR